MTLLSAICDASSVEEALPRSVGASGRPKSSIPTFVSAAVLLSMLAAHNSKHNCDARRSSHALDRLVFAPRGRSVFSQDRTGPEIGYDRRKGAVEMPHAPTAPKLFGQSPLLRRLGVPVWRLVAAIAKFAGSGARMALNR